MHFTKYETNNKVTSYESMKFEKVRTVRHVRNRLEIHGSAEDRPWVGQDARIGRGCVGRSRTHVSFVDARVSHDISCTGRN